MAELSLICNIKTCRMILNTLAWVTSCSHIFCDDCSRRFNREKKCPCCNEILNRLLDIVQINLNPDEAFKSMILCGLSPEIVMDISSRAITFWKYQMAQENIIQTSTIKQLEEKLKEVTINKETLEHKFEQNLLKESKRTETALKDAELLRQKLQAVEAKLMEKSRTLLQFQSKNESLKLQLIHPNTMKSAKTPKAEQMKIAQLQLKPFEKKTNTEFDFAPSFN